jgi:hypothetical protein
LQRTLGEGEEAAAPSNIRIIQEVQGGEVVPPDGGIVRPKNVKIEPLFSRGVAENTIWGKVMASPEFGPW